LSSFTGRKVTFGTPHSQTPPKPTAMPLRLVPLSRNTLTSWLPSGFGVRMRMRSLPGLPSRIQCG
jgi:hypothetical protein